MSLAIKTIVRQSVASPRCFKHWERDLGFTNRAGIETYQNLQHFLRGINYLTHSKAIGRAEAALEKRIEILSTDPYHYSEDFNRQLRHNAKAMTHRWLTISSIPGIMFLADHLIDKQALNPADPFLIAIPTAVLMGIGHFLKLKRIVEMVSTYRLEKTNLENEARFRQLSEATSEALLIHRNGIIVDVNNRACQVFGFTKEEMVGTHVLTFAEPGSHQKISGMMQAEAQGPYEAEFVGIDNKPFYAEVNAKMTDFDGERLRIAAIRDITEKKQSERIDRLLHDLAVKLSAVSSLNEALAICTDQAIKMTGMDSGGFYVRDQQTDILELKYANNLSQAFIEAIKTAPKGSQRYHLAMAGQPIYANLREHELTDPDLLSEGLTYLASIPISQNDQVIGCLNIASHSMTELPHRAKYALEMIASQVGGALARLQSQQLIFDMDRIVAAGKMAGQVSHSLKNAGVVGTGTADGVIDLSLRMEALFDVFAAFNALQTTRLQGGVQIGQALNRQIAEHGTRVKKVFSNIQTIMRNMLSLSRVRTEEKTVISIKDKLEETLQPLARLAVSQRVKMELNLSLLNEADGLFISETVFQDIIRNLVANAIESFADNYEPAGGRQVRVIAHPNGPSELVISVEDNGPGMPPERLATLFSAPVRSYKKFGTGIGLVGVREGVKSARGDVKVTSEPMRGTAFTVTFPRILYEGKLTQLREAEFKPLVSKEEARQLTVYLVDDDLGPLDVIETRLKKLGFKVISFTNPESAIAAYGKEAIKPDIVLTDQGMPQMAGDQLLTVINQLPAPKKPRYIVYTGDPPPEDENDPLLKTVRALNVAHIQKGGLLSQFDYEVTKVARGVIDQIPAEEFKAKLRQAGGKERVNNPYSVMTGRIAHDMNNHLGALIGNAELLLSDLETGYDLAASKKVLINVCLYLNEEIETLVQFTRTMTELETTAEPDKLLVKSRLGSDQRLKDQAWNKLTPADRPKLAVITQLYLSPLVFEFRSVLERVIQTTPSQISRKQVEELIAAAGKITDLNSAVAYAPRTESLTGLAEKFQEYYRLLEKI